MIDPSIITNATRMQQLQQQQNMETMGELGGNLGRLVLGRRLNTLSQLKKPEERQAFANNSVFAPYLNAQIKADDAAALKLKNDQLQFDADLAKTKSETFENTQSGNKDKIANAGVLLSNADKALTYAAQSGDSNAVKLALNNALKAEAITPELYDQYLTQVSALSTKPEELKKFATSVALANTKDPMSYLQADANTVANNTATMRGQDIAANTAKENRIQQQQNFDTTQAYNRNKFVKFSTTADGYEIGYLPNGRAVYMKDENGNKIKAKAPAGQSGKPQISDKAQASVSEMNMQLATAKQSANKISGLINDVKSGKLNLSTASQGGAWLMNRVGLSDENTRGIENFNTAINEAANNILMQAKGTQTEGDAQRVVKIIADNPPRDNASALQVLQRLAAVQQNIINVTNGNIDDIYNNYGATRPQAAKPTATTASQSASYKGSTVTLSDVKQAAQQAGVSTQEMVQILQGQGVRVK